MAAILCKGLGNICNGCCKLCILPCKLLGVTVDAMCSNPFCLYVTATLGFNIPPIFLALSVVLQDPALIGGRCKASLWLVVNVALCVTHIVAGIYIAVKYKEPAEPGQPKGFDRAKRILCYDPWIAVYLLVYGFFFIWLCVGSSWKVSMWMDMNEDEINGVCVEGGSRMLGASVGIGFAYIGVGACALCMSLCCIGCGCMPGSDQNDDTVYQIPSANGNGNGNGNGNSSGNAPPVTAPQNDNKASGLNGIFAPLFGGTKHNNNNNNSSNSNSNQTNYAATAAAAATPVPPTSAPPKYDVESNYPATAVHVSNNAQEPVYATVVEPSAPPMPNNVNNDLDREAKAAANGTKIGGKLSKLVNADEKTKVRIESTAAKAGVAASKGLSAVKKMAGLKK